ncbi:MAG TPA: phosphatidylglycerol lysyltransferase domain-containing protein [Spirochaetales bacterium]|nr:phosphatidylglycerol lysyltransferase domain-containing protein [Spirochaetales bacterium]
MPIPIYPESAPISLEMRDELYPSLNLLKDGISEFNFSNLFLFRHTYGYRVSRVPGRTFVVEGSKQGKSFFYVPCAVPDRGTLAALMDSHDYLKNLSETQAEESRLELESWGYRVEEDRDNFDYLYRRTDLAELSGKEYHKKRNLVNAFLNSYSYEQKPLSKANVADAVAVLDEWRAAKGYEGDYAAAREALELYDLLGMRGCVYYVDGAPAGWCLGEPLSKARMFAVHFEKACDRYKGIYQFINQAFAQALPAYIRSVNREQDLGNEGLRQAKMTYRPSGFVKKYRVVKEGR